MLQRSVCVKIYQYFPFSNRWHRGSVLYGRTNDDANKTHKGTALQC